jgi:hypothetical protein
MSLLLVPSLSGCERGEVLEDLPGLSEITLPPENIELNQTVQARIHLPSATFC